MPARLKAVPPDAALLASKAAWDNAITQAKSSLLRSREALARTEGERLDSAQWKHFAVHQSALALARRHFAFDQETLRAARLRALNGRIERIRRGPSPEAWAPEEGELFTPRRRRR